MLVVPDRLESRVADVGKCEPGQHARRVTGQRGTVGSHGQEHRAPAVHACLGTVLEVIRDDEEDSHPLAYPLAEALRDLVRSLELLAGG